ncbi:ABC transporter permease subunit [bacterium]|nr:ABC transporter permease subunit [bacterium]
MTNELVNSPTARRERTTGSPGMAKRSRFAILSGRQGRRIRESLLAYLFLFPAFLIVGLFGLFPLVFAAYQSSLRGINRILGTYDGLGNYVNAMGQLTYVLGFGAALVLLFLAVRTVWEARKEAAAKKEPFWRWALPGALAGAATLFALGWIFRLLPLLLAIPDQMRSRQRTPEPFDVLMGRAFMDSSVLSLFLLVIGCLVAALVLNIVIQRSYQSMRRLRDYSGIFTGAVAMTGLGIGIGVLTWVELQFRMAEAESAGGLDIWTQVLLIGSGFVLVALSWMLWQSASGRDSNLGTGLRLAGGAMLLVGGWLLIGELPRAIGSGDDVWWNSLAATFFYALGTVPAQLIISLMFAVMLFQDIKGKSFFRMVYFLPYIAPFVGTAAVFKIIFSSRPDGPINAILDIFNISSLRWLNEPSGILNLMGDMNLPGWTAGPSLALIVIMIFGVWTFFGFNTVVFLAGLGNIPRETYEAASIDGATRWSQFRHITLPLLSPTIYFLTLYSVIGTFKAFNHIYVLRTGAALGTTDTASVVIFQMFKRDTRYGYASALAILLLLIIIILTVVNNRIANQRVHYG